MFCKKCGKDIGDAKYCQYCGNCNDDTSKSTISTDIFKDIVKFAGENITKFGHDRLINIISWLSMIISLIVRIVCNEIEVVYVLFVSDDYFVISEGGKAFVIVLMVIQALSSVLLYVHARYKSIVIPKRLIVLFIISLVIQILMISIRLPAPYW